MCSALVKHARERFGLTFSPGKLHSLTEQTFCSVNEALTLFVRLASTYLPPTRFIWEWTAKTVDLFACTDAADTIFSRTDPVAVVFRDTQDTCIYSLKALANLDIFVGSRHTSDVPPTTMSIRESPLRPSHKVPLFNRRKASFPKRPPGAASARRSGQIQHRLRIRPTMRTVKPVILVPSVCRWPRFSRSFRPLIYFRI